MVPVFKNIGRGLWLKSSTLLVFLLWLGKSFEILVINGLADHLKQCSFFPDFQYGFRFSQSIVDVLTVVFDRIARVFSRSGAKLRIWSHLLKKS